MNFLWNMEIFRQFSVEFKCHLAGCSLIVSALNLRLGLQSVECQPWHALQHLGRFLYLPGSSKGCWVTEWMVRGAYTIPEGSNSTLWKVLVCGGFKWFLFSPKKSLGKRNPFLTNMFQLGWNLKPPTSIFLVEKNRQVTGWFWRVFAFWTGRTQVGFWCFLFVLFFDQTSSFAFPSNNSSKHLNNIINHWMVWYYHHDHQYHHYHQRNQSNVLNQHHSFHTHTHTQTLCSIDMHLCEQYLGWWFQILFFFIPTWGNDPIWLYIICFNWVETINHLSLSRLRTKN